MIMEKFMYVKPEMKMLLVDEDALMEGYGSIDENDPGQDLSKQGFFFEETSGNTLPKAPNVWEE